MAAESQDIHLSVVIPAYNEVGRLGWTLERVLEYLSDRPYRAEVLVVNRGKGYSVRRGMLEARGRNRLFSDADLSTPIEHTADLLAAIEAGADVAVGSRAIEGSDIQVHQSFIRENAGKMFSVAQRALLGSGIKDTQCGFKVFSDVAAEAVFPRQTLDRWAFDAELVFIAQRLGLDVVEVPVRWVNSPDTKVKMLTDGLKMVVDVARIRWRHAHLRQDTPQLPHAGSHY